MTEKPNKKRRLRSDAGKFVLEVPDGYTPEQWASMSKSARYKARYPDKHLEIHRAWREKNRTRLKKHHRNFNLQKTFGITHDDYEAMLAAQGECCWICKTPRPATGKQFPVDHCHTTGAIRGILCEHCNQGLGRFKDNTEYLAAAIAYLQRI